MQTHYVLIDYENVQPKSLSALSGHAFKVMLFVGEKQTKIPLELVKTLQPMGENADYVLISGNGRNALDFHIAFYLGELAVKDPAGCFYLISKDTGFDPLLAHLKKQRSISARRVATLTEIPVLATAAPKSLAARVEDVVKNLTSRGRARPRNLAKLKTTIHALFAKSLDQTEVDAIVAALEKREAIVVTEGAVSYSLD